MNSRRGRILGVDYGLRRIGLSLSDGLCIIATPLPTLQAARKAEESVHLLLEQVKSLEKQHGDPIVEIVIGLPLRMDGSSSHLADEVHYFVQKLRDSTQITITTWDERLSSVQADRSLREAKLSRKKRSQTVDAVAAVIILQSYLDSRPQQL